MYYTFYTHTHKQALSIPDNDKLSAQVATAINADLLILLSDVDGLYTGRPSEPGSRLIKTYHPEQVGQIKFWGKSRVGRGGMESKVEAVCVYGYTILYMELRGVA